MSWQRMNQATRPGSTPVHAISIWDGVCLKRIGRRRKFTCLAGHKVMQRLSASSRSERLPRNGGSRMSKRRTASRSKCSKTSGARCGSLSFWLYGGLNLALHPPGRRSGYSSRQLRVAPLRHGGVSRGTVRFFGGSSFPSRSKLSPVGKMDCKPASRFLVREARTCLVLLVF